MKLLKVAIKLQNLSKINIKRQICIKICLNLDLCRQLKLQNLVQKDINKLKYGLKKRVMSHKTKQMLKIYTIIKCSSFCLIRLKTRYLKNHQE